MHADGVNTYAKPRTLRDLPWCGRVLVCGAIVVGGAMTSLLAILVLMILIVATVFATVFALIFGGIVAAVIRRLLLVLLQIHFLRNACAVPLILPGARRFRSGMLATGRVLHIRRDSGHVGLKVPNLYAPRSTDE